jgi:hypothetical protein
MLKEHSASDFRVKQSKKKNLVNTLVTDDSKQCSASCPRRALDCLMLQIKPPHWFKTLVTIYQSTWYNIPEDLYLHEHHCRNLRSYDDGGVCNKYFILLTLMCLCNVWVLTQTNRLWCWQASKQDCHCNYFYLYESYYNAYMDISISQASGLILLMKN